MSDAYVRAMTVGEISAKWPNLSEGVNFQFTSPKKKSYNCVAYILGITHLQICMGYFSQVHGLDKNNLDDSVDGYANVLSQFYGFEICENLMVENGFDKVVLYGTANRGFEHVALQLPNGNWTSKMGDYEDIEHYSLDAVAGDFYGHPLIYMKRERIKLEK